MIIADLPSDENERLEDLRSFDILDTDAEADFDGLVELAGHICKCPISLITLLDKDRQWFKAKKGIEETGSARDVAFCSHAILNDDVLVVDDASKDQRFWDNPLVTGDLNIRFYAGAPIVSPSGKKLGTICIIDHHPRKLSAEERRALVLLSNQVTKLLEIRRKNILIRERAEEIVSLKSQAIKLFLKETEETKKQIAIELHEDYAQSLASAVIYLQMAETQEDKRLSHVRTARQQLSGTLAGLRDLSYKVTPLMIKWMSAEDTITTHLKKIAVTFPFSIQLSASRSGTAVSPDITLAVIRMIEQWLKLLSYKKDISAVDIIITLEEKLSVQIEDGELSSSAQAREKDLFRSILFEQIHAMGGIIELSVITGQTNVFKLTMPLVIAAPIAATV